MSAGRPKANAFAPLRQAPLACVTGSVSHVPRCWVQLELRARPARVPGPEQARACARCDRRVCLVVAGEPLCDWHLGGRLPLAVRRAAQKPKAAFAAKVRL